MPRIVTEILLQFNTTCPDSLLTVDGLILTVDGFLQNLGCRRELSGFAGETRQTRKRPKVIATKATMLKTSVSNCGSGVSHLFYEPN